MIKNEPGVEFVSPREARRSLEAIRDVMARSTRFTRLSGPAWMASGLFALAGALVCHLSYLPIARGSFPLTNSHRTMFAFTWGAVFALSLLAHVLGLRARGSSSGDPNHARLRRDALAAFGPAFIAGAILTRYCLGQPGGFYYLIAPLWMFCYGLGLLAASLVTIDLVRWCGAAFIVCGAIALERPFASPFIMLAVAFGGLHLVFGFLLWRRNRHVA